VTRDIGTVVVPDADVKIFLVADLDERVRRRVIQARERGYDVVEETIVSEIMNRDKIDSGRKVAPLKPAPDSITIDTTGKTPEETIMEVAGVIYEILNTYIEIITGITEPPRFRLIVQRPRYMGISTKPPTRINKTATKACLSLRCMRSRTLWASPRKTTTLTASSRISPTVMLKPPSSVETASLPHPGK
jgi:hypothetical protein